jgi:HAE1 family hydrophobic/amphiphilic exporter-1
MAIAVIGGLLSSTILTLVVIPVIYSIFEDGVQLVVRILSFLAGFGFKGRDPEVV